eukprot:4108049-Amphidinium_carterae.1
MQHSRRLTLKRGMHVPCDVVTCARSICQTSLNGVLLQAVVAAKLPAAELHHSVLVEVSVAGRVLGSLATFCERSPHAPLPLRCKAKTSCRFSY